LVSALAVLLSATIALANVVERILGTPDREEFRNIQHDLGFPVTNLLVFATVWVFYRRVVQADAARETEVERAATIRRLYTYLIATIGLGMFAVGTAGAIGVLGSQVMGVNTHGNGEPAAFLFHLAAVRADRSAQLPTVAQHSVTVLVRASDAAAARARLASALEGQADISLR